MTDEGVDSTDQFFDHRQRPHFIGIVTIAAAAIQPPPKKRRNNTMQVKTTLKAGLGPFMGNNG